MDVLLILPRSITILVAVDPLPVVYALHCGRCTFHCLLRVVLFALPFRSVGDFHTLHVAFVPRCCSLPIRSLPTLPFA